MEQKPELPGDFNFDGKFYRYGEKKQKWAIGKEWSYKGNMYQFIKYGDFKAAEVAIWKSFDDSSREVKTKLNEQLKQIVAIEKYETEKKNEDCQKKWFPIFTEAPEYGELHPYLIQKKVKSNYLARVSKGTLMVPAYDQSGFQGVQLIYIDVETGRFKKIFSTGIKKKGSFVPFPNKYDYSKAEYIFVAEGFATAATVYEATGIPTICAFDSGNLFSVIQTIRSINPGSKIIICADDDKNNVGMKKAIHCKNHYSNVVIRKPKFEYKEDKLTDFNDLASSENLETVKEQLKISETDFVKITALGSYGDKTVKYFYFSSMTNRIHQLSAQEHNKNNLLQMAPKKYWGEKYGTSKDAQGDPTTTPLWGEIPGALFVEQSLIGFFNPKNVRGVGPWMDQGRFVYNLGDKLLVNGEECLNLDTRFLYQTGTATELTEPLTDLEGKRIIEAFKLLNYKNPHDHVYLCGWIAMAPIFNFIDWRPHVWVTGQKGSGKSSIVQYVSKIIGTDSVYQSVTAAAIRQTLKHDAMPMVIDEAEPGAAGSKYRMEEVIEVIRQCSTRMATKTIRGSSSGDAVEYNVTSCFMLGSIQPYLPTEADVSRFFQIEILSNEGQDSSTWQKLQSEFAEFSLWSSKLLSRMIPLAPTIKSNIDVIRTHLIDQKIVKEARQGDQIATAIACYYALYSDKKLDAVMDDEKIMHLTTFIDLDKSDYFAENNGVDESEACLEAIMDIIIDRSMMSTVRTFIERVIEDKHGNEEKMTPSFAKRALAAYGVAVFTSKDGRKCVGIKSKNMEMLKALKDSGYVNYMSILKRHKKATDQKSIWIDGRSQKGVVIELDHITSSPLTHTPSLLKGDDLSF